MDDNGIIEKYGPEKVNEVWELMQGSNSPTETIKEALGVSSKEALEFMMGIMAIKNQEVNSMVADTMKRYEANRSSLPSCPKPDCEGKLHQTISRTEELSGMYHCDSCRSLFRRKTH